MYSEHAEAQVTAHKAQVPQEISKSIVGCQTMPHLDPDYTQCDQVIGRLLDLHENMSSLPPHYQKVVAEIISIRLFDLLQNTIKSITLKILCGALYLDGSAPSVLQLARNRSQAINNMSCYSRPQAMNNLRWSKVAYIKENIRYVLAPTDHLVRILDAHGSLVSEVRSVRNRVAHNNKKSRENYRIVVRRHYGDFLNAITPGTLLLSPRKQPTLLDQYLMKSRILIKELVKA